MNASTSNQLPPPPQAAAAELTTVTRRVVVGGKANGALLVGLPVIITLTFLFYKYRYILSCYFLLYFVLVLERILKINERYSDLNSSF